MMKNLSLANSQRISTQVEIFKDIVEKLELRQKNILPNKYHEKQCFEYSPYLFVLYVFRNNNPPRISHEHMKILNLCATIKFHSQEDILQRPDNEIDNARSDS